LEEVPSGKNIKDLALGTRAYFCVDCSKCTGSCPIGIAGEIYSPRAVVQHALMDGREPVLHEIWRCLTCGTCKVRCPSDVDYPEFVRGLREIALKKGLLPQHTHGGVIREMMRIMSRFPGRQKRTAWVPDWVKIIGPDDDGQSSEDLYFVGCAPYFDIIFDSFNLNLVGTHIAALELLRSVGIRPAVLADEVCCGHDALWSGDRALFERLARLNAKALERAGAKRVFVSCPEGYHTLCAHYGDFLGNRGIEIVNTVAFLAGSLAATGAAAAERGDYSAEDAGMGNEDWEETTAGLESSGRDYGGEDGETLMDDERREYSLESALPAAEEAGVGRAEAGAENDRGNTVTIHDPCRMGRFSGLYDQPRALLGKLPGLRIREMEFNRDSSPCCGSNLWVNCDQLSKKLQSALIREAGKTGAGVLITSCDKCRIHLACAGLVMGEAKPEIETRNILEFFNERR
jgi:Fe-S oxidoreductase